MRWMVQTVANWVARMERWSYKASEYDRLMDLLCVAGRAPKVKGRIDPRLPAVVTRKEETVPKLLGLYSMLHESELS